MSEGREMRQAVIELVKLGQLPASDEADVSKVEQFEQRIAEISGPVSDDEARALIGVFGSDDCFGLAWSLLHLIESAPNWPLLDCLRDMDNEWVKRLYSRAMQA